MKKHGGLYKWEKWLKIGDWQIVGETFKMWEIQYVGFSICKWGILKVHQFIDTI